jgi:hypothetical protein
VGKRTTYDLPAMAQLLLRARVSALQAVLELAIPMPGQSSTATLSQGYGIGVWEGLLVALQIPYTRVQPSVWKRIMLDGFPKTGDIKGATVVRVKQLFPAFEATLKRHHNRADALLLAAWLRRTAR